MSATVIAQLNAAAETPGMPPFVTSEPALADEGVDPAAASDSIEADFPCPSPDELAEPDGVESGAATDLPQPAEETVPLDVPLQAPGADPDLWLYRDRTVALLRRYMRLSIEVGRMPSLLGREFFRTRVTRYKSSTFEDSVIFVHDVEVSLEELSEFQKKLIAKVALQQYSKEEAGRLLGCGYRTVERLFPEALDRVSEILLRRGILAGLPKTKREVPKTCPELSPSQSNAASKMSRLLVPVWLMIVYAVVAPAFLDYSVVLVKIRVAAQRVGQITEIGPVVGTKHVIVGNIAIDSNNGASKNQFNSLGGCNGADFCTSVRRIPQSFHSVISDSFIRKHSAPTDSVMRVFSFSVQCICQMAQIVKWPNDYSCVHVPRWRLAQIEHIHVHSESVANCNIESNCLVSRRPDLNPRPLILAHLPLNGLHAITRGIRLLFGDYKLFLYFNSGFGRISPRLSSGNTKYIGLTGHFLKLIPENNDSDDSDNCAEDSEAECSSFKSTHWLLGLLEFIVGSLLWGRGIYRFYVGKEQYSFLPTFLILSCGAGLIVHSANLFLLLTASGLS